MAVFVDYDAAHEEALRALWTAYLEEGAVPASGGGVRGGRAGRRRRRPGRLGQFRPPDGRLLLAVDGGEAVGCGAVRVIAPGVAEIKRMYLRRRRAGGASAGRCCRSCWPRPAASAAVRRGWTRVVHDRRPPALPRRWVRGLRAVRRERGPGRLRPAVEVHAARSQPRAAKSLTVWCGWGTAPRWSLTAIES